MSKISFHLENTRQYEHYSSSVFSIIKLKTNTTNLNNDSRENIIRNIIFSKYYLWNYEHYPDGYPYEEENLRLHGAFNRDKIAFSDYSALSYRDFFNDVITFIINEISFTDALMKRKDEIFLNDIIKELIYSFNDMIYYKLNLELNSMTDVDLVPCKDKISKWHPFSIFKSYIVFNLSMTIFYIIQIGDD